MGILNHLIEKVSPHTEDKRRKSEHTGNRMREKGRKRERRGRAFNHVENIYEKGRRVQEVGI